MNFFTYFYHNNIKVSVIPNLAYDVSSTHNFSIFNLNQYYMCILILMKKINNFLAVNRCLDFSIVSKNWKILLYEIIAFLSKIISSGNSNSLYFLIFNNFFIIFIILIKININLYFYLNVDLFNWKMKFYIMLLIYI